LRRSLPVFFVQPLHSDSLPRALADLRTQGDPAAAQVEVMIKEETQHQQQAENSLRRLMEARTAALEASEKAEG
jgi:hypothetical protein